VVQAFGIWSGRARPGACLERGGFRFREIAQPAPSRVWFQPAVGTGDARTSPWSVNGIWPERGR